MTGLWILLFSPFIRMYPAVLSSGIGCRVGRSTYVIGPANEEYYRIVTFSTCVKADWTEGKGLGTCVRGDVTSSRMQQRH